MDYLFDFFFFWFDLAGDVIQKVMQAVETRRKKEEQTKMVDANEMPDNDKIPESVKDKTSQDNMDISREDFAKLSKEEQKKYREEWNALSEPEKQQRLSAFAQKQLPVIQQAYHDEIRKEIDKLPEMKELKSHDGMAVSEKEWKTLSKAERTVKEDQWKALSADEKKEELEKFEKRMDAERGKVMNEKWNEAYQKYVAEHGAVHIYKNPKQNVPKCVRDQMAVEIQNPMNGTSTPLPVSRARWEKMNSTQKANFMNSYNALTPEQRLGMMKAFQANQQKNIAAAWNYYSNETGNIIQPPAKGMQYAAFSNTAAGYVNSMDQMIQQQKKQSQTERQKNELQNQRLDGRGQETELQNQEIENNRQLNQSVTVGPDLASNAETSQPDRNGITQTYVPQVQAPQNVNLRRDVWNMQRARQIHDQAQEQINASINRQPSQSSQQRLDDMQANNIGSQDLNMSAGPVQGQSFGAQRREDNNFQMNSNASFNQSMNKYENNQMPVNQNNNMQSQNNRQQIKFGNDVVDERELDEEREMRKQEIQKGTQRMREQRQKNLQNKEKGLGKGNSHNQSMGMGALNNNK